ncbi:hypothetical protein ACFFQF_02150 [Haladaptatus pallidirubidus]|uniref:Uncharacterized protein n=1 Tax=Haladaptatus pallidirubidus TaxID=1008152 RepID=A0AAV3UB53_9EURY|nr:hypothetical protein [Haladaptatus pallidirubidus]
MSDRQETDHLEDVPDGSGCTEIWEHLSERRDADEEEETVEE